MSEVLLMNSDSYITSPMTSYQISFVNNVSRLIVRNLQPGLRKVKLKIPITYISTGETAKKIFDIGKINLEIEFDGEERELLPSRRRRVAQNDMHKLKGKGREY